MTVISWSLEFIAGLVALAVNLEIHDPESNVDFITCGVIVDALLNFIIIPSSYILNNEVMKTVIIAEGWCKIVRNLMRSNKVTPSQNETHENIREASNTLPIPIPTVSGNLQALQSSQKDLTYSLENDFTMIKMIAAENLFTKL